MAPLPFRIQLLPSCSDSSGVTFERRRCPLTQSDCESPVTLAQISLKDFELGKHLLQISQCQLAWVEQLATPAMCTTYSDMRHIDDDTVTFTMDRYFTKILFWDEVTESYFVDPQQQYQRYFILNAVQK